MSDGMLALTWNNHSTTFFKTLSTVRVKERYTDVTLSCDGKFYQLHKIVLSTCSEYFEKIFENTPCKHPVIVLRDVSSDELEALLNYMYLGSVSVAQNDLARLIKVAELFQIKGLAVPDEPPKNSDSSNRKSDGRSSNRISESNRTRPSDGSNAPLPKRQRTNDGYASGDQSDSSLQNKDYSRLTDRSRMHGSVGGSTTTGESDVAAVPGIQGSTFDIPIKQEIIHDVRDSDSEDQNSMGAFDTTNDPDSGGNFEPTHEDSQNSTSFVPKSEPENIVSDDTSISQSGLEQDAFKEDMLGIPGPSDAQGWYPEGDASGGLSKGGIDDENQEMLSMMDPQQQQQQQMISSATSLQTGFKTHHCRFCSYSTTIKTNLDNHILVHTGEKPYNCHLCPAKFAQKGNLKIHMFSHTGEKRFACPLCPYKCSKKQYLVNHQLKEHNHHSIFDQSFPTDY